MVKKSKKAIKKVTKVTKKAVVAKRVSVPAKSSVKVTIRKQILGHAPEEKTFVLHDGRKLRSIYELVDELETMNDGMFREYVFENKNYFADWVEHVFSEKGLADELRTTQDRIASQRAILKHIVRELECLSK